MHRTNIFFIAVVLALSYVFRLYTCIVDPIPVRDAYVYQSILEHWNNYKELPADCYIPPLSLWLLRIPSYYFGYDIIKGGIIINMLLGLGIVFVVLFTCKKLMTSRIVFFVIGMLIAIHPSLVYYSAQMLRENSYLFFSSLFLYYLVCHIKKQKTSNLILASLFSSMALLCRYEAIELFIVLNTIIILIDIVNKKTSRTIFHLATILAIFGVSLYMTSMLIGVSFDYYKYSLSQYSTKFEVTDSYQIDL